MVIQADWWIACARAGAGSPSPDLFYLPLADKILKTAEQLLDREGNDVDFVYKYLPIHLDYLATSIIRTVPTKAPRHYPAQSSLRINSISSSNPPNLST
jgi:hypothetical protein